MISSGQKLGIRVVTKDGRSLSLTSKCVNPVLSSGAGGFMSFDSYVYLGSYGSFVAYNNLLGATLSVSWGGGLVWEGRIEDLTLLPGGISLTALGAARALSDLALTLFMSDSSYEGWREVTGDDIGPIQENKYNTDKNNRLFISPKKGQTFTNNASIGGLTVAVPHNSILSIKRVTFNYAFNAPGNWRARLNSYDHSFGSGLNEWELISAASLMSGTADITFSSEKDRVLFIYYNSTGSNVTTSNDDGVNYLKITDLRLYGIDDTEITAKDVIDQLVGYISGVNPSQLSAETGQVGDPGLDLTDQIYEDAQAIDIIEGLQALGDDQTPPRFWRAAVWEGKRVQFQPVGKNAKNYEVSLDEIPVTRSIDQTFTGIYGTYKSGSEELRADRIDNQYALAKLGFSRFGNIRVNTTSASQVATAVNAAAEDARRGLPFSEFAIKRLFYKGITVPVYSLRPGDIVTVRNWPPILGADIDRVRRFRVLQTSLDLRTGILFVTPESYPRSLDQLIARRAAGLG